MRLLPRTLGGQLAVFLIAALIAAQAISFFVFAGDRADALRAASRVGLLENMGSVMRVLAGTPRNSRSALAAAAATPRIRYWITDTSAIDQPADTGSRILPVQQFDRMFGMSLPEPPRLAVVDNGGAPAQRPPPDLRHDFHRGPPPGGEPFDVLASVPFADGGWLNAQTQIRAEPVPFPWPTLISAVVMIIAILVIIGVTVRRATRPLAALADTAETFGRGGPSRPLPEAGPSEVRRLTAAFNRMQDRLERFIADRTRMMAAIGHDLRTPITSLKLRVELLDDEEARTKMMATLDDMQRMTEATLAFARDDAGAEPVRSVDLQALVESLTDDLSALGHDVSFKGGGRLPYSCRPTALKRAIGNLLENAVRYGKRARVTLDDTPEGPVLVIDDDGPGIPADRLDDVFKPFVRLETSRSRETGGVGLGLSISRSIVLAHGGDIKLSNRPGGGLRVEMTLPPSAADTA
jgi:signal transduction histidine kinase